MKTLYLDCSMGAAGDMLTAALLELFENREEIIRELNDLGIPHVQFERETVNKCGIRGTHIHVRVHGMEEGEFHTDHQEKSEEAAREHHHGHTHRSMDNIEHIVNHLNISEKVRKDVLNVYSLIADAESKVHGVPVSMIHFHEVGNLDAIADVTAVCVLLEKLSPEKIVASAIHVGSGQVKCAHGVLPVPAPATAVLLQGCPIYGGSIKGELCTPTAAALLKYFADEFGELPAMTVEAIGYGMGKKDFEAANCVRAMLGKIEAAKDVMVELNCNVDDMTGEQIGFALERFFTEGAVEAFTIPIQMKKSRPGTLIRVLCSPEKKETLIRAMFKYTSTAGIRESKVERSILHRNIETVETAYGPMRKKQYSGYGVSRYKYEYEDLAKAAMEHDLSIEEILKSIEYVSE